MIFVDRRQEMRRLLALSERGKPGLVALWGRRRVGKTRLLVEWCAAGEGLYTVADLSAGDVQRRYFAGSFSSRLPAVPGVEYPDWRSLLSAVSREAQRESWCGPLILDEFPNLVESSPDLPSILQNWIDHDAAKAGLLVAVAGSSRHMMQGLVLDSGSPLFGRAVESLQLAPMPVHAVGEALGLRDPVDAVSAFAAWGGIPRYWELAEPFGKDVDAAVESLVLDPLGPLHLEPDRLLSDERPTALALRPILDAIGSGAHRVSEIAGRIGQPATSLSRALARLADLDLVARELPFGEPARGSKTSLYKISDNFFRLWFRAVAPNRAILASSPGRVRMQIWKRHRDGLLAEAWEALCRASIPFLGEKVLGEGPFHPASRLWGRGGPEWDLAAASLDGRTVLLGEAKWSDGPGAAKTLREACSSLDKKGAPLSGITGRTGIVRVVFVPRATRRERNCPGFRVLDASDVVGAFAGA